MQHAILYPFLIAFLFSSPIHGAPIQEKQTWQDEAIVITKMGAAALSEAAVLTGLVQFHQKTKPKLSGLVENVFKSRLICHAARRTLGAASRTLKGESLIPNKNTIVSPIQDALCSGIAVGLVTKNTAAAAILSGMSFYFFQYLIEMKYRYHLSWKCNCQIHRKYH